MERNEKLDFFKGICILLVVAGHCMQYGMGFQWYVQKQYFDDILFKIIYSFHMPLFMTVSGWIFSFSTGKYSIIQIMKKKIKRLIVPALAWPILMSSVEWAVGTSNLRGGEPIYSPDEKMFYRALVFMGCLFMHADSTFRGNIYKRKVEIALFNSI